MTSDTLLLCPFCGGTSYVADDFGSSYSVKCNNPICGGAVRLWATREKAIAAWNRRARESALREALIARDAALEEAAIQCDKREAIYMERGDLLLARETHAIAVVIRALRKPKEDVPLSETIERIRAISKFDLPGERE